MGVFGINVDRSVSLGKISTIFQAEVMAIKICAEMVMLQERGRNEVHICSGSQVAIKALSSTRITSNTVWECLKALKRLASQRTVHITWIPGHNGHEGNEMEDGLARQGAEKPYIGPEPVCDIPKSFINSKLRDWETDTGRDLQTVPGGHRDL